MTYLHLDQLRSGMVLAADVTTTGGYLLLKSGTVITIRQMRMLKGHGILGVEIHPSSVEAAGKGGTGLNPVPQTDEGERLHERFRHTDTTHPLIRELVRLYKLHLP